MRCGHCHQSHDTSAQVMLCGKRHDFKTAPRIPLEAIQEQLEPVGNAWPVRPVKPTEVRREERRGNLIQEVNELGARVPVGRYALRNTTGPNNISFYHVERPDNGRYAGKTFVKQQLGPNVERIPMAQQRAALVRIAADPAGAFRLYGRTLGVCGVCGLTLTNEESRAAGIGPVCRKNMGY